MANRSESLQREIDASVSLSEEKKARPRRSDDGWRSDHEAELSRYFSGDYAGAAGLRSHFGNQLEQARDGMSFSGPGFVEPQPPRGVGLHGEPQLEVVRVEAALRRIPETAVADARAVAVEKVKKFGRRPTDEELAAAISGALAKAEHHLAVLRRFYSKHAVGEYHGLLGLEPYAMVCPLTVPVVRATAGWMREELEKELAHAGSAAVLSAKEAENRLNGWRKDRAELAGNIEAYEATNDMATPEALAEVAKATEYLRELDEQIRAATQTPERIDVPAIIRAKWERAPSYDECRSTLRRANEQTKPSKITAPELRAAAKKLVDEALSAAKRDLGAARQAYADAREAGRQARSKTSMAQATIEAFDRKVGLR